MFIQLGSNAIASEPAAIAPAHREPPSRRATRHAKKKASTHPARAIRSHRIGATSPVTERTPTTSTGSGFQDGPEVVSRSKRRSSSPHAIHAHGSGSSANGSRTNDSPAIAKEPARAARMGRERTAPEDKRGLDPRGGR